MTEDRERFIHEGGAMNDDEPAPLAVRLAKLLAEKGLLTPEELARLLDG